MMTEVTSQGFFDMFQLFDKELIEKVKKIAEAIDPEKIKQIMEAVKVEDGKVTIDLRVVWHKD